MGMERSALDDRNTQPILSSALEYVLKGYSIVPVRPDGDKKPYLSQWKPYQAKRATREEIKAWWQKWPNAMIGIVTGKISNLLVLDCDTPEAYQWLQEHLSDTLLTPIARTPRGGKHVYFSYPEGSGLTIGSDIHPDIKGLDLRAEGGYVIAPPSVNTAGKLYEWANELSIFEVAPPPFPEPSLSVIKSFAFKGGIRGDAVTERSGKGDDRMFVEGRRDNDLFHIANCLVRGGATQAEATQTLVVLARSCTPPFPEGDITAKVKSALKRAAQREGSIASDVRAWVETTSGYFETTACHRELQLTTKEQMKAANMELLRLCEGASPILEHYGGRRGSYRRIEHDAEDIDFLTVPTQDLDLRWPFEIERFVRTLPKNIIVVAGEPNAGKTAFLLNVVKLNMGKHDIRYFSSEMGALEFQDRLSKFDIPLDQWRFKPKERSSNFADVIAPDAVNIIDFLEIHDEFYKVGKFIKEIYDKLDKGVAIIGLQKNTGASHGLGGLRGAEKARLYLTMEQHVIKIIKAKNWTTQENPNGLELHFGLVKGCQFRQKTEWKRTPKAA